MDAVGPRRLMLVGIVMAGGALVGLSTVTSSAFWLFYLFYGFNALGYVFGGPLPNQVMLSRYFDAGRGKAMGIAYLGIGIGGAIVLPARSLPDPAPRLARRPAHPRHPDDRDRASLRRSSSASPRLDGGAAAEGPLLPRIAESLRELPAFLRGMLRQPAFYLLALGSMASIGAVGGTMQNLKFYLSLDRGLSQVEAGNVGFDHPDRQHRRGASSWAGSPTAGRRSA